jgi:hypothetical protein
MVLNLGHIASDFDEEECAGLASRAWAALADPADRTRCSTTPIVSK